MAPESAATTAAWILLSFMPTPGRRFGRIDDAAALAHEDLGRGRGTPRPKEASNVGIRAPSLQKSAARVNGSALIRPDRYPDFRRAWQEKGAGDCSPAPEVRRRRVARVRHPSQDVLEAERKGRSNLAGTTHGREVIAPDAVEEPGVQLVLVGQVRSEQR